MSAPGQNRTFSRPALTIAIHYEALAGLSRLAPRLNMRLLSGVKRT